MNTLEKQKLLEICKKVESYIIEDDFYDDSIISGHTANRFDKLITALQEQLKAQEGKEKEYEIDFDGNCKAKIKVTEEDIVVLDAMNGYGDLIPLKNITITK